MEDDVAGLRHLAGLLADCGQIILTVPAYPWLWGGEDVISGHHRRYTGGGLREACTRAGLEPLFSSHFNLAILPAMAAAIAARRVLAPAGAPRSNVRAVPGPVNRLLYRVAAAESRLVGTETASLPAGASIVCRLRRKGAAAA